MKKVYGTYRHKWTSRWVRYTPSYFLDKQYEDYINAWLTAIKDSEIPENRYTAEIAPWIKKKTRFIIWEYNEDYIDPEAFKENIAKVWAEFAIWMFDTPTEAIEWLKANTDLEVQNEQTDDDGNTIYAEFVIYPERTDEETGETIPAKILVIE